MPAAAPPSPEQFLPDLKRVSIEDSIFETKSRRFLTIYVWNIFVHRIWNSLYWVRKGRYPYTFKENQQTFLELLVTKTRTVVMDVGGGKWTAGPLDGGPSNNGNKQLKWVLYTKKGKYVKYDQYKNDMHNMHNMQIIKTIC
jgi:hypothetical protein